MFGFGRVARRDQPSTARRKSGGTLRKAEYERRRAQRLQASKPAVRTREAEAARVSYEYRRRRTGRLRSKLPVILIAVVVIVAVIVFVMHGCSGAAQPQ